MSDRAAKHTQTPGENDAGESTLSVSAEPSSRKTTIANAESQSPHTGAAGRDAEYDHEDDSYDEEEEEEEEEEPALRYKRLGGNIHALFEKDTASTLMASDRFLVLGTHWGHVVIIDFEGNEVKKWRAHSTTVNAVSVDIDNEYVASAGDDGRVVVHGLYNDDIVIVDYNRPVKAVALDPYYSRKTSRRFISGGTSGQLIMYEKKWLGKSDTIMFTSTGPIQTIQWQGLLVAWACDEGVQIYDMARGMRISQVARPEGSPPRADLYICRLYWRDTRTLVVGWANIVQIVTLKERIQAQSQQQQEKQQGADQASGPLLYAEISVLFRTDFIICGLAIFRDHFMVLSYGDHDVVQNMVADDTVPSEIQQQKRARDAQPPELRMINWNIEEVSSDVLTLEGFPLLQPNDYGLAYFTSPRAQNPPALGSPKIDASFEQHSKDAAANASAQEADSWFILSPKQLVSVRSRGLGDHVQWLTERGRYQQALADIEDAYADRGPWAAYRDQIKDTEYREIGQAYAHLLMDEGNTAEAAQVCARVLPRMDTPDAAEAWESWVFAFAEANALNEIAPHIPTEGLHLSNTVYEMVLAFLLTSDISQFRHLVFTWPPTLFNAYSVVLAVEDQLLGKDSPADCMTLKECLALLYDKLNQPAKSLKYHLELFAPEILDRVLRENLFDAIRDKAQLVLRYDDHTLRLDSSSSSNSSGSDGTAEPDAAELLRRRCEAKGVQLLTDNTDAIPCASVVKQLVRDPEHLHVYLHALLTKDPHLGAPFADLQVELYAEYNVERLLHFLRLSTFYSFDKALEICEERGLVPEMVFILGRMGDNHQALMLIIDRLGDVPRAIEFAKEQSDPELWTDLVMYARDKPEFIIGLLELGGTHTNPTTVIRNIPTGLSVPGIRDALTNVLHDYHLQVELCTDCKHVLDGDCEVLSDGLHRLQHQGMGVDGAQLCLICQLPLEEMPKGSRSAMAFWCGHIFHDKCVLHPDVLRKTVLDSSASSSASLAYRSQQHRMVHSPGDQRKMMTQTKLDRTMMIRQFSPTCPVCADDDQKKTRLQQTLLGGWSPRERKDNGTPSQQSVEADEQPQTAERHDLPPIQTLSI
ncbi:Vacuolar protein sorting-associated protein 41 [Coemansia sp. RSA 986]|nr:Vacuolar protein sorting-associated protein 41 [Coemansia sp. RSA 986]